MSMRTRMIMTAAAATVVFGMSAGSALAETWQVFEGPDGKTTGVWTVEIANGVVTGSASMMTATHKPLTYALSGKVSGTTWTIDRIKPSDSILCTYQGSSVAMPALKKSTEITGSAYCQARTGMWKVRIMSTK